VESLEYDHGRGLNIFLHSPSDKDWVAGSILGGGEMLVGAELSEILGLILPDFLPISEREACSDVERDPLVHNLESAEDSHRDFVRLMRRSLAVPKGVDFSFVGIM
jgi:hypothetical protein